MHRRQKAHGRFLDHGIGVELARREIARRPTPSRSSTASETGCRRRRCPCDWRSARAGRAARRARRRRTRPRCPCALRAGIRDRCAPADNRCRSPHRPQESRPAHSCASRRTACSATESVAKSGGEPVRRSTTIRFSASTGAACRGSIDRRARPASRPLHFSTAPVILRCSAYRLSRSVPRATACQWPSDREALDLLLDPGEADALAEIEIGLGGIADLDARGHCATSTKSSAQCRCLERCDARRELFGYVLLDQLRAQRAQARLRRGARARRRARANSSLTLPA